MMLLNPWPFCSVRGVFLTFVFVVENSQRKTPSLERPGWFANCDEKAARAKSDRHFQTFFVASALRAVDDRHEIFFLDREKLHPVAWRAVSCDQPRCDPRQDL